jgi:hypothetical protein
VRTDGDDDRPLAERSTCCAEQSEGGGVRCLCECIVVVWGG